MYTRDGVLAGKQVILRAVFTDDLGLLVAPDSLPDVYIYSPSVSGSVIAAEVEAATYTSATVGPLSPTLVAPGLYELTYTVPAGWTAGTAWDVWDSAFSSIRDYTILGFEVQTAIAAAGAQLKVNEVLTLTLDKSIANLEGDLILAGNLTFAWTTQLNPFCVSVELVQMTLGPWVEWIPPATLAMMIHWSSMLAAHSTSPHICDQDFYNFAKAQFVIYDIALKAYYMPGSPGSTSGGTKRLGDFSINMGGSSGASGSVLSSGVDLETVKEMKKQHRAWMLVVNSGACLLPGQSIPAAFSLPGWNVPGRVVPGRMFEDPASYPYVVPTQNEKYLPAGHVRTRHRYGNQAGFISPWSRW